MAANLADFTEEQLNMALVMIRNFKLNKVHPLSSFDIIILWETQILNALNEVREREKTANN